MPAYACSCLPHVPVWISPPRPWQAPHVAPENETTKSAVFCLLFLSSISTFFSRASARSAGVIVLVSFRNFEKNLSSSSPSTEALFKTACYHNVIATTATKQAYNEANSAACTECQEQRHNLCYMHCRLFAAYDTLAWSQPGRLWRSCRLLLRDVSLTPR